LPSGIKGKNSCQIPILQKNANLKGIPWPPKMIWGWELWDGSRMELKQSHKQKFKAKFICSNQKRRQLMQIEAKKVNG
jgi:hypothetical protein